MKRKTGFWLTAILSGLCAIFLVVFVAAVYLLNSEWGTQWIVARLQTNLSGKLSVDEVQGTISRGLHIKKLEIHGTDGALLANDLEALFAWTDLFSGQLSIQRLRVKDLRYQSAPGVKPEPKPFNMSLPKIPLTIAIKKTDIDSLTISDPNNETRIDDIHLSRAQLTGLRLTVNQLTFSTDQISLDTSDIRVRFRGPVPARGKFSWHNVSNNFSGQGSFDGSLENLNIKHALQGPYPATSTGTIKLLNQTAPLFNLTTVWAHWQFAEYSLQQGSLRANGKLDDYQLTFSTGLVAPNAPTLAVSGAASGNQAGFSTLSVEAKTEKTLASLAGDLSWSPILTADVQLRLRQLDLAMINASLIGSVSGEAQLVAQGTDQLNAHNILLSGDLNNVAFNANGNISWTSQKTSCLDCSLRIGVNRLQIDADYENQRIAARIALQAPKLDQFNTQLGGSLFGRGTLNGPLSLPQFTGELNGTDIRYGEWSADSVTMVGRSEHPHSLQTTLSLDAIRHGSQLVGSPTAQIVGGRDAVEIDLRWLRDDMVLLANGSLQRTDQTWSGQVKNASVSIPDVDTWYLDHPTSIRHRDGTTKADAHTWSAGQSAKLQITNFSVGEEVALSADLKEFPLAVAKPLLPVMMSLKGHADAHIQLSSKADAWEGNVLWRQTGTVVRLEEADAEITEIPISLFDVEIKLVEGGARGALTTQMASGLSLTVEAALDRLDRNARLSSRVQFNGDEWGWLPAIIPNIDDVSGAVTATLNAEGPLVAPDLTGNIQINDGRLALPALNVYLDDINAVISGEPRGNALIKGQARAGDGHVSIDGQVSDILRSSRSVKLTLEGEYAEVFDWPEYRVWASPKLDITEDAGAWSVTGTIEVPRAEFVIRSLPESAVKPSTDVKVVDQPAAETRTIKNTGQVRLNVGDRVHIQAMGLNTWVYGDLLITQSIDAPMKAEGQLVLTDGKFSAFGQMLTIRKGTLTFVGPIDNPIVDVQAIRDIDQIGRSIIVGVRIRGNRDNLTTTVFSEPAMNEADALAYLLTGGPLTALTEAQSAQLSGAALTLGISQAARITQEIGRKFGIDQLAIMDSGDETSVVAGKDISSNLYTRYAYGVFSQISTVFLGYRLSEHLRVEAGAGENQSVNLLYRVERP